METGERSRRPYRQRARAEAVAAREARVLEAAFDAFFSRYFDDVTLKEVAEAAGTTEQTVLRHFGSKQDLLEATMSRLGHRLGGHRVGVAEGDWRGAVQAAADAYEEHGARTLRMLAQEDRVEPIRRGTDRGRAAHRDVTVQVFRPWLPAPNDPSYEEHLAPFLVALDVYTWKLLRLDAGLNRDATVRAITHIVECLIRGSTRGDPRP